MTELRVGIARHAVVRAPGRLICVGVGSCVVITLHDPDAAIGALAHVLLPEPFDEKTTGQHPARFATTAVPLLISALQARDAGGSYVAKLTGGATLFADVLTTKGRVGHRNVDAARAALARVHIAVVAEDVGGESGRSIVFDVETGHVTVRPTGGNARVI